MAHEHGISSRSHDEDQVRSVLNAAYREEVENSSDAYLFDYYGPHTDAVIKEMASSAEREARIRRNYKLLGVKRETQQHLIPSTQTAPAPQALAPVNDRSHRRIPSDDSVRTEELDEDENPSSMGTVMQTSSQTQFDNFVVDADDDELGEGAMDRILSVFSKPKQSSAPNDEAELIKLPAEESKEPEREIKEPAKETAECAANPEQTIAEPNEGTPAPAVVPTDGVPPACSASAEGMPVKDAVQLTPEKYSDHGCSDEDSTNAGSWSSEEDEMELPGLRSRPVAVAHEDEGETDLSVIGTLEPVLPFSAEIPDRATSALSKKPTNPFEV